MPERVVPEQGMSEETLEHHLKRYAFAVPYVEGKTVLSVACGTGYGEDMLMRTGAASSVTGVDVSEEAVAYARDHYQTPGLTFMVGDVTKLALPDASVDVVVSFETVEHIQDEAAYFSELTRVLKPDGVALISTPNRAKSWKNYMSRTPLNPYHVREYVPSQFRSLLKRHFHEVQLLGQKTIIKRRWFLLPYYGICKVTGRQRVIEVRNYDVVPYPRSLFLETAIMVAVCTHKKIAAMSSTQSSQTATEAFFEIVRRSRIFNTIIAQYGLDTKTVLDVGCSHGAHLACFGEGSEGVTVIDEHIEYGRSRGLTIHKIDVESPSFTLPKQFDVVWANNFFEHMNCPHVFLRRASALIKDDGVLILGVPVIPFFSFLTRFKKFRGAYASSHVNFFTRRTLIETVRYAGYEVIEARLFFMRSRVLDWPFLLIAPHMYVVARPKKDFVYSKKRMASLTEYEEQTMTGQLATAARPAADQ